MAALLPKQAGVVVTVNKWATVATSPGRLGCIATVATSSP